MLYNAGPLDVSWAVNSNKVVAILESFFPAQVSLNHSVNYVSNELQCLSYNYALQTGGSALFSILTGTSPAGRLPSTWPASLDQVKNNNIIASL